MAKAIALFFFFFLGALVCHLHGDDAQKGCRPSDISVKVDKSKHLYHGKPEYTVTFRSQCHCPMEDVHVTCSGLEGSVETPDPSKVEVADGVCALKQPVVGGKPYSFSYAVDEPITFRVLSGHPACGV
ncbi:hypothetical protein ACP70R_008434 [Stipagrostis hirtigluma subsp. patula]